MLVQARAVDTEASHALATQPVSGMHYRTNGGVQPAWNNKQATGQTTEQAKLQAHTSLHAQLPSEGRYVAASWLQELDSQQQCSDSTKASTGRTYHRAQAKNNQSIKHSITTCTKHNKLAGNSHALSALLRAPKKADSRPCCMLLAVMHRKPHSANSTVIWRKSTQRTYLAS